MAIALGDPDSAFDEGAALLNFGFAGFKRRILVREGERLGRLRAGGRRLPVASGDTLLRLVPRHTAPRIRVRLRPLPSLSLPIVAGSTVGRGIVFAGGRVIGKVDAVAETSIPASAPASAEPSFEPGPLRHLEAVARVLSAFLRAVFGALPIVPE